MMAIADTRYRHSGYRSPGRTQALVARRPSRDGHATMPPLSASRRGQSASPARVVMISEPCTIRSACRVGARTSRVFGTALITANPTLDQKAAPPAQRG
jgi:hypothetical protein